MTDLFERFKNLTSDPDLPREWVGELWRLVEDAQASEGELMRQTYTQHMANASRKFTESLGPVLREARRDAFAEGLLAGVTEGPHAVNPYVEEVPSG